MDEGELIVALRAGEEAAFERIVRQHAGRLLAVTRRILGSDDDAQDAVQDAFLSASRSIDRFDGRSKLGTWLHRIAVNAALMKLRSRRRKPEHSIDEFLPDYRADGHHEDTPLPWKEDALAVVQRQEIRDLIRASIKRLPENYRDVLLLRDIEGFDTQETASMLDLSADNVKSRLHRARQALRTLLDPHLREGAV